jgi:ABC-type transport system involved in cytochrome c biogenesis permease subunit
VDRATAADIPLFGIAVTAMIIYVTLALGKAHPIDSKVLLGLSGNYFDNCL